MGRNPEPVDLILAKERSHHLTKQDIENRREQEVPVVADGIKPPSFLRQKKQKQKFNEIANALKAMKIISNADCDVLGRYIICQEDWERYGKLVSKMTSRLERLITAEDEQQDNDDKINKLTDCIARYERFRTSAFQKCQECAGLLGMTITGRCRITLPKKEEKPKENKFSRFKGA